MISFDNNSKNMMHIGMWLSNHGWKIFQYYKLNLSWLIDFFFWWGRWTEPSAQQRLLIIAPFPDEWIIPTFIPWRLPERYCISDGSSGGQWTVTDLFSPAVHSVRLAGEGWPTLANIGQDATDERITQCTSTAVRVLERRVWPSSELSTAKFIQITYAANFCC